MKYKVGDKVKIKSLDWYNENKDNYGAVYAGNGCVFWNYMALLCGEIMTISTIKVDPEDSNKGYYFMENSGVKWTDEMIESLVEEEPNQEDVGTKIESTGFVQMGKIVSVNINNANYEDEVELQLEDYEIEFRDGKIYAVKKKPKYPTTYEECFNICFGNKHHIIQVVGLDGLGDNKELFESFIKLKICRDAYWKMYGEQMGLDGPWEPDWENKEEEKYTIEYFDGMVYNDRSFSCSRPFAFPTEEMRNNFKENFDQDIEICKEFL